MCARLGGNLSAICLEMQRRYLLSMKPTILILLWKKIFHDKSETLISLVQQCTEFIFDMLIRSWMKNLNTESDFWHHPHLYLTPPSFRFILLFNHISYDNAFNLFFVWFYMRMNILEISKFSQYISLTLIDFQFSSKIYWNNIWIWFRFLDFFNRFG